MARCLEQARAPAGLNALFPPRQQQQLRIAAALRDHAAIDAITDELVAMGLCRPRSDAAVMTRADVAQAVTKGRGLDCS